MIAEKKRKTKKAAENEPKTRFYVKKWDATPDELSEIRSFVRVNKYRKNSKNSAVKPGTVKKIKNKLVR